MASSSSSSSSPPSSTFTVPLFTKQPTVFGVLSALAYNVYIVASTWLGCVFLFTPLLPLLVVSPRAFVRVVDVLQDSWLRTPAFLLEHVAGVRVTVSGDALPPGDRALVLSNHRTRLDWMFLWCLFARHGRLANLKIILKDSLKRVPGPGWAMQVMRFVFLARAWARDEAYMTRVLRSYTALEYPVQLLLFPEGTDYCQRNVDAMHAHAADKGVDARRHVLLPRHRGFQHCLALLRPQLDAVHDVTIAFPDYVPQSERSVALGLWPERVHFHVTRHAIDTLPADDDEAGLRAWLDARWLEKDRALDALYASPSRRHPDAAASELADSSPRAAAALRRGAACMVLWLVLLVVFVSLLARAGRVGWLCFAAANVLFAVLTARGGGVDRLFIERVEHMYEQKKR